MTGGHQRAAAAVAQVSAAALVSADVQVSAAVAQVSAAAAQIPVTVASVAAARVPATGTAGGPAARP